MKCLKLQSKGDRFQLEIFQGSILIHVTDSLNNNFTNSYELPRKQISKVRQWLGMVSMKEQR
jgi:hypothetical protein